MKNQITLPGIDENSYAAAIEYCKSKPEHTYEQTLAAMAAFGYGVAWKAAQNLMELEELKVEIERLALIRAAPMCGSKHIPPIGYTCSLGIEDCVVCKETEKPELMAESYRVKLAKAEDVIWQVGNSRDGSEHGNNQYICQEYMKEDKEARKALEGE